ncbi:hypothetical protein CSAL01_13136 [Colletotrichum salicis]|uniref:Uncharacterized protein n=1 Tax=Colletotrichum salicis TaxID=1209931 RepID=A0A135V6B3_9PEZI|nr:hypothetical protein CSAL01_13136 [Colletotrichum salicis]
MRLIIDHLVEILPHPNNGIAELIDPLRQEWKSHGPAWHKPKDENVLETSMKTVPVASRMSFWNAIPFRLLEVIYNPKANTGEDMKVKLAHVFYRITYQAL